MSSATSYDSWPRAYSDEVERLRDNDFGAIAEPDSHVDIFDGECERESPAWVVMKCVVHVPQCLFDILLGNIRRAPRVQGDTNTHVVDVPIGFVFLEFTSDGDVHPVRNVTVPQPVGQKDEASAGASRILLTRIRPRRQVRKKVDVLRLWFEATDAMLCRLLDGSDHLIESSENRVFAVARKPRILRKGSPSPSDVAASVLLYVSDNTIHPRIVYLGNPRKKVVKEGVNLEFGTVCSCVAEDRPTTIEDARVARR